MFLQIETDKSYLLCKDNNSLATENHSDVPEVQIERKKDLFSTIVYDSKIDFKSILIDHRNSLRTMST